MLASP